MSDLPDIPAPSTRATSPAVLWTIRLLSVVALTISGYLAWLAVTGRTAAGCGEGSLGCERVLSSRWSYVLDVPVSIPAISLWLTVVCVSLFAGQNRLPALRRSAWMLLTLLTTAAVGAAGWFMCLQAFKLHHWCLYCMAAHACALMVWVLVVTRRELIPSTRSSAAIVGLILATTLPLAQKWFPRESYYNLHRLPTVAADDPIVIDGLEPTKGIRYIEVLGGAARINVDHLPRLGAADSKYVVVSLYDYACDHCRQLHGALKEAQLHYDGDLSIVMLPTPLSHHCNPYLTEKQSTSPDACALAKLALIVAQLKPERFIEFDEWLFASAEPRSAEAARQQAERLVGAEALATVEQDASFDRRLRRHIELYHASPAKLLPQIMGSNVILSEGVESTGELLEALEQEFGFR